MCNKVVDNYPHALEFVPERLKAQRMCDKAVDTYPSTIKFVPKCFMIQEMCDKAVNRYYFVFDSIRNRYKTQEICDKIVSEDPCFIIYYPDKYVTRKISDEAIGDSIATLKLVPDRFVTSKMIKKLFTALYADENILYFNEDSGNVVFSCNEIVILNIDFNNINLDNNFDEDDPDTTILTRILAWHTKFEKRKALEKDISEELMPPAWHPNRW